jgi:hypothetical protein
MRGPKDEASRSRGASLSPQDRWSISASYASDTDQEPPTRSEPTYTNQIAYS